MITKTRKSNFTPLTPQELMVGEERIKARMAAMGRKDVPTIEEIMRSYEKRQVRCDSDMIMARLSQTEQSALCFVPLVIAHAAWTYAEKAVSIAIAERVVELKDACRQVRRFRQDYDAMVGAALSSRHRGSFISEAERWMGLCARDFAIFYFTVNQSIKTADRNCRHEEMATFAAMSALCVLALMRHNHRITEMVSSRLGFEKATLTNPHVASLKGVMGKFVDMSRIEQDKQVGLCLDIFRNNIDKIEFTPVEEE